jgi:hypothetical protein
VCPLLVSLEIRWIWGSLSGNYGKFYLLGYSAESSWNISPPFSGPKSTPSKKPAFCLLHSWFGSFFNLEYGGDMFFRNVHSLSPDYLNVIQYSGRQNSSSWEQLNEVPWALPLESFTETCRHFLTLVKIRLDNIHFTLKSNYFGGQFRAKLAKYFWGRRIFQVKSRREKRNIFYATYTIL